MDKTTIELIRFLKAALIGVDAVLLAWTVILAAIWWIEGRQERFFDAVGGPASLFMIVNTLAAIAAVAIYVYPLV